MTLEEACVLTDKSPTDKSPVWPCLSVRPQQKHADALLEAS